MKFYQYLSIYCLILFVGCNTETKSKVLQKRTVSKTSLTSYIEERLNKKFNCGGDNYFLMTLASDSTIHLSWGNDSIKRTSSYDFDLFAAEKLRFVWGNNNYLILKYGVGSGAWMNEILPINRTDSLREVENALCFDSVYNLIALEQFKDTILSVQNLRSLQVQYIIDKEHRCGASLNNSCIDSISIINRELYLKWILPYSFADKKQEFIKRVPLRI